MKEGGGERASPSPLLRLPTETGVCWCWCAGGVDWWSAAALLSAFFFSGVDHAEAGRLLAKSSCCLRRGSLLAQPALRVAASRSRPEIQ